MAKKFIPYYPDTIKGQAILNNITRTKRLLKYHDGDKVYERIKRGLPLFDVELIEQVRSKNSSLLKETDKEEIKNLLIRGECIAACAFLKAKGIKVDLVYVDPPFASGADYAKKVFIRRNSHLANEIKKVEETLDDDELRSFEEKMYGDFWNKEDYLNWMFENLSAIKAVISETASLYFHLDWNIGHYVKIMLDEIFGEDNFQNEIIWKRTTSKAGSKFYNHIHDTIFFYTLNEDRTTWNQLYTAYSDEYIRQMFKVDENGLKYRESPLTAPGKSSGPSGEVWKGINPANVGKGRHWAIPSFIRETLSKDAQENTVIALEELENSGRIIWAKEGKGMPNFKQYIDDMEGVEIQSIWSDVNGSDDSYSTQKPEALLERIIKSSSNEIRDEITKEKMIVADFFGGSGVTAKVSNELGRDFIHVDIGINSIQTTRDRLIAAGADFDVLEVKDGVNLFRNPIQTMDKLATLIHGLQLNKKYNNAVILGIIVILCC